LRPDLRVSIVLPAHNEETNLAEAIRQVVETGERLFVEYEVIVVDDGSRDGTRDVAEAAAATNPCVRVISHRSNGGYGEALRTGFRASRLDFVFFTDADLQFDISELELFLPYAGTVDAVVGYRLNREDHLGRRLMAYAWNVAVRVLFYVPARDIDCAFKLLDRRVLEEIEMESLGAMFSTEMMVRLGRRGASVVEVGVHHYPRRAGRARGASPRVIALALRELFRLRRELVSLDHRGR
jgi:glycosyltransferase involved in cell wall biosynthesis